MRMPSPVTGSTLTTSMPRSPRIIGPNGPARYWPKSMSRYFPSANRGGVASGPASGRSSRGAVVAGRVVVDSPTGPVTAASASPEIPTSPHTSSSCSPTRGWPPWIAPGVPRRWMGTPIWVVAPRSGSSTVATIPFACSCGWANWSSGSTIFSATWLHAISSATSSSQSQRRNASRRASFIRFCCWRGSRPSRSSAGGGWVPRISSSVLVGVFPLITETWTNTRFAHSKIIPWCTPGGWLLAIRPYTAASACSAHCQICVEYSQTPCKREVCTCWPRPVSSRASRPAHAPLATRKIAPTLGNGIDRKIGPGRHPGCSHCAPDAAWTSASYPGRCALRWPAG